MNNNPNIETYFLISSNNISINVYDKKNLTSVYHDKKVNDNFQSRIDTETINLFLERNIFKIEKIT